MVRTVSLEEYSRVRSKQKGTVKRYAVLALFLAPFLLAFIVFFLFPLVYGVYISLTNFKFSAPDESVFHGLKWYKYLLGVAIPGDEKIQSLLMLSFWRSFLHSIIFSIIMVPIAVLLPLGLAILVNIKPPAFKLFRSMIYLPSIVPLTAAGTIFTLLFMNADKSGVINTLFGTNILFFDGIWFDFEFLGTTHVVYYGWIPIFFMCLWGGWGGNFIILSAGLQNIPRNLYEAASIDGCSSWRQTLKITIPGIKPQLVLCLFTTIIGYLGLYGQNFVLTSGGPLNTADQISSFPGGGYTSTVMYFIQDIVANNITFKEQFYGLAAAASIIYAAIVGTISGIQMYITRDKKTGFKKAEAFDKWQRAKLR